MSGIEIALGFALMEAGVGGAAAGWIAAGTTTLLPLILGGGAAYASSLLMPEAAREDKVKGGKERVGSTQPRTRIYGKVAVKPHKVHDVVYGADKRQYMAAFAIADHEIQAITRLICDDKKNNISSNQQGGFSHAVDGYGSGADARLLVAWKTGTTTDTAFGPLVNQAGWSSNHRGRGVAKMFLRASYRAKEFPSRRPPEVKPVVEGAALYNPLLDSTQTGGSGSHRWANKSTWAYSRNAALALYDHLRGNVVNGDLWGGCGYSDDEIDVAAVMSAISVCAATITNPDSTTRPRYAIDYEAVYGREADLVKIAKDILKAMDGVAAWRDGKFWFAAGSDRTPVATLTDDDFHLGDGRVYQVSDARAEGLINEVMGTYTNAAKSYRTKEIKPLRSTSAIAADGRVLSQTVDLPMVTDKYQARQIMRQILERSRLQWNARVSVGARWAMALEAGDIILWQSARWGWTRRFLIKEVDLVIDKGIYANLTLEETASAVWDAETTEYDEGDGYEGEPPPALAAPQNLTATAIYETGDNGKKIASTAVNWTAPDDVTLQRVVFRVRRKTAANNARQYASDWDDPEDGAANVRNGMGVDGQYEIRASFVRGTEPRTRVWTSWVTITSEGDGGGPGDVTPPPRPTRASLSYGTKYIQAPKSGQATVEVEVTWGSVIASDLDQYRCRYRRRGAKYWRALPPTTDPVSSFDAAEGTVYEFQVRAVDQAQNASGWTPSETEAVYLITATTDKVAPKPVSGVTLKGGFRRIAHRWRNPRDRDLRWVEVWGAKKTGASAPPFSAATLLDEVVGSTWIHEGLGVAETWYYWYRAEDTSGNPSTYYPSTGGAGRSATTTKIDDDDLGNRVPGQPGQPAAVQWESVYGTDGALTVTAPLAWTAPAANTTYVPAVSYQIEVTRGKQVSIVPSGGINYAYVGVPGGVYSFRVRAVSRTGKVGAWSTARTATAPRDTAAPPAPQRPTATGEIRSIVLTIPKVVASDFKRYDIFWQATATPAPNSSTEPLDWSQGTRFVHGNLTPGTSLYYWVRSVDRSDNASAWVRTATAVAARKVGGGDVGPNEIIGTETFRNDAVVTGTAVVMEKTIARKAGTKLRLQFRCVGKPVPITSISYVAVSGPIIIKRNNVEVFRGDFGTPTTADKGGKVLAGGKIDVDWTDETPQNANTNVVYKIERVWPDAAGINQRYCTFTHILA